MEVASTAADFAAVSAGGGISEDADFMVADRIMASGRISSTMIGVGLTGTQKLVAGFAQGSGTTSIFARALSMYAGREACAFNADFGISCKVAVTLHRRIQVRSVR